MKLWQVIVLTMSLALYGCGNNSSGGQFEALDPAISVSLHDVAAPEGAAGEAAELRMRITLTAAMAGDLEFNYSTRDLSAQAGVDYIAQSGDVSIPAGALSADIVFNLIGDDVEEATEQFEVSVTGTSDVPIHRATAKASIANDDTACDQPANNVPNRWLDDDRRVLNYAHRGGVIDFPENTLYAYKEVAKAGADVMEMDVYETSDGELVILHDLDVDRTTNGTGLVGEKTLAELRELDAAYWFVQDQGTPHDAAESAYSFRGIASGRVPPPHGYTAADFRIPTLEEALQALPDYLINVELKPDLDGVGNYETAVAQLLQRYGRIDDVIVASFVDAAANNFKAVAPCFPTSVPLDQATALILASQGAAPMPTAPEHVALQVPPDTSQVSQVPDGFFLQVVTEDFLQDARNANLAVHVWTVNECEEMIELIDLGVDAIMTDRPLLLEQVLAQDPASRSCADIP